MKRYLSGVILTGFVMIIYSSCSTPGGPAGIFGSKSPHEKYGERITNAGLKETTLGRLWFDAAEQAFSSQLIITVPYREQGYFTAERPTALGLRFSAKQGEQLKVNIEKKPASSFLLYLDLWKVSNGNSPKLVEAADSTLKISYEVKDAGDYILRLQPELLKGGEYTLTITSGPSLAFPFNKNSKASMASFWGAERDRGARKHEGIDIMAPRRTPVIAAAEGTITRVNENRLGGKTVWLRPLGKDYNLYYAHLDEQLVSEGQQVTVGDTLGLVGTTGNAQGGPPHLHFGIYGNSGAVDPFPFLNPTIKQPGAVMTDEDNIGKNLRTITKSAKLYQQVSGKSSGSLSQYALLQAEAGTGSWYRVRTADNQTGFVQSKEVATIANEIRTITLRKDQPVFDFPATDAARVTTLPKGTKTGVLAEWNKFAYIKNGVNKGWIDITSP